MIFRIVLTVFLSLVLVGCADEESSSEKTPPVTTEESSSEKTSPVTTAKSEKKALQGLQSLTRVQLKVSEGLHAYAVEQLRKQLPQLNTAGSPDDWTLEFVFGVESVPDPAPRSVGPQPKVTVRACHCRLFRKAVVNGRFATAVAYKGAPSMEQYTPFGWARPYPESSKPLLLRSITEFAAAWRQANPNSKGK